MPIYQCPHCKHSLNLLMFQNTVFWHCPQCDGRICNMDYLRNYLEHHSKSNWHIKEQATDNSRSCPVCHEQMFEITADGKPTLDICKQCQLVWFDPNEYERFSELPPLPTEQSTPVKSGIEYDQSLAKLKRKTEWNHYPTAVFRILAIGAGLPVEMQVDKFDRPPYITWSFMGIIIAVSVYAFQSSESFFQTYGLLPLDMGRMGGLTLISSFFLHGSVVHLIGNLYFFNLVGDNVEDDLGIWRYLLLILTAHIVGGLTHALFDSRMEIPLIGASAGISGLMVYYALRFTNRQLGVLFFLFYRFHFIRIPVLVALVIWIAFQGLNALMQLQGATNVSALAHLGGALVGFIFWLIIDIKRSLIKHKS